VAYIFGWNASWVIAMLFIAAMAFFVGALVLFLREVLLAVGGVRVEHR